MFRKKGILRATAIFLLLNTINFTFAPTIAWALTAGPTAPEATSFEPVDTTDMVNLITGDLTYNIPLLEVPGPSGGYPLSLSYHAGIMPNEEASWVGLGWTLNPGAITRMVNGYPDDIQESAGSRRDYWKGGNISTWELGVTLGVIGVAGVSASLEFSQDTYQGFGLGTYVGGSVGILGKEGKLSPFSFTAGAGTHAYGGSYASAALSAGFPIKNVGGKAVNTGLKSNLSIGVRTNFNTVQGYGSAGISNGLLGASISASSSGLKGSLASAGGRTTQSNGKAGKISISSSGFKVPIPMPFGSIDLGYEYQRYWSDETAEVKGIGTLYPNYKNAASANDYSFDSYALLDPTLEGGIVDNPAADKVTGGSFPAYDSYNVNAQGLGGSMQPYIFEHMNLFRQNQSNKDNAQVLKYYHTGNYGKSVHFRFNNDFSNKLLSTPASFTGGTATNGNFSHGSYNLTEGSVDSPTEGYKNNHLAGSKHIEYFTNEEIIDGTAKIAGFIDYHKLKEERDISKYNTDLKNQIGGYMITNETGVTYHYALPAYSYGEVQHIQNVEDPAGTFANIENTDAYAYTWYLTAVTGPDYVDKNNDGLTDANDWGYWVKFDYGLWADSYKWRNPAIGTHKDLDGNFENFSYGQKELYYLNIIQTKSHTAVFVKEIRKDGKGVSSLTNGGFSPKAVDFDYPVCDDCYSYDQDCGYELLEYNLYPTSTLALKDIYLFKNDDFKWNLYATNTTYAHSTSFEYPGECPDDDDETETIVYHHGRNVIDIHDITNEIENDFKANALRTIHFNQDYSLTDKTENSFVSAIDVLNTEESANPAKSGKLTLNALRFLGKRGADLLPAMNFTYGKNPDYKKDAYDMWGMYKSDYVDTGNDNENLSRFVSAESSKNVDAWSLTKIKTNLGAEIKIDYESDTYKKPELYFTSLLNVSDVVANESTQEIEIFFYEDAIDLRNVLSKDSKIDLIGVLKFSFTRNSSILCDGGERTVGNDSYEAIHFDDTNLNIVEVKPYSIKVNSSDLFDKITEIKGIQFYPGTCYTIEPKKVDLEVFYNTPPHWEGGNLSFKDSITILGGGIRVVSISVSDGITQNSTYYTYESGVTSFEPIGIDKTIIKELPSGSQESDKNRREEALKEYKKALYQGFADILANTREVPVPGVMYEYVTVTDQITHGQENPIILPGKTKFHFQVFEKEMVEHNIVPAPVTLTIDNDYVGSDGGWDGNDSYNVELNNNVVTIKDHSSKVGRLISVTTSDDKGNALTKSTNQYVDDDLVLADKFNNQGVIHQSFSELKEVFEGPEPLGLKGVISKREEYPSVLLKTVTTNYKTGIEETSETLAFDFYSGAVTKTLSSDGYGNYYVSESTPAYRVPEYAGNETTAGMGLKVMNPNNKHMLTQVASTKVYKVASATDHSPVGLLSAGVQTWSNDVDVMIGNTNTIKQPKIWRKHKSYAFVGDKDNLQADGTYNYGQYTDFTWWSEATGEPAESTRWQKQSELTLYDVYSHALEATDINGNYAATKMGLDQTKIKATAANASYDEFAYAGMEDVPGGLGEIPAPYIHIGGSVYVPVGSDVSTVKTHTGDNSLKLTAGKEGFRFTSESVNKTYRVSVWSTSPNADIKYKTNSGVERAVNKLPVKQAGDWYLLRANVTPNEFDTSPDNVTFYCEAKENLYLDDFRVHPIDAAMTSYVYNEWDELSHILDANNLFTEYKYDGMGRLESTYKETFQYGVKKISEVKYNYGRDKKLLAEFTHSGNQLVNKNLLFNAVANSATLGTTTYTWDFGDGTNVQTGLNVNHTYSATGVYTVKLSVSNTDYSTVSKTEVMVINNPLTLVNVCANGYIGYDYCGEVMPISGTCTLGTPDKEKVTFNVTVGKLSSGCSPYHYQWQKKPNSSWVNFGGDSDVATEFFTSEGSTGIRCKVTDACGANVTSNTVTIARFKSVAGCTVVAE